MGKIVFYYGTMNSSKTANLIMTAFNYEQQGKDFHIIKSSADTRDNKIRSRALDTEMDCTPVSNAEDILKVAKEHNFSTLFIDECQFMSSSMIEALTYLSDEKNIQIIAYGLLTTFEGELFEGSKALIENAESIREIKNQCLYCDNKAIRNLRIHNGKPVFEGTTNLPGHSYQSICRSCFNKFKKEVSA